MLIVGILQDVLFSIRELITVFGVSTTGVLHIGAHLAEEFSNYEKYAWTPVTWIEANPSLITMLEEKLDRANHRVIQAVISDIHGELTKFYISNNTQSSSLLEFGLQNHYYQNIYHVKELEIFTSRVDKIMSLLDMPNFLNLDIQGTELQALKSLGELIHQVDYIYTEINKKELYLKCSLVEDLDLFLGQNGFKRVATRYYLRQGWGDALYIRVSVLRKLTLSKKIKLQVNQFRYYFKQYWILFRHYLRRRH